MLRYVGIDRMKSKEIIRVAKILIFINEDWLSFDIYYFANSSTYRGL